jgi:anti-sigma regulatory factor (Ser/Thr protein kinase)
VQEVRRLVGQTVREWGGRPGDAALVVGELAANAVVHGRSLFTVTLGSHDDRLLVEVSDLHPGVPVRGATDPTAVSGRGLHLVEALALTWGVRADPPSGKTVWAELPLR